MKDDKSISLMTKDDIAESFETLFDVDDRDFNCFMLKFSNKTITNETFESFRKICLPHLRVAPENCFLRCLHFSTLTEKMLMSLRKNGLLCRDELEKRGLPSVASFIKENGVNISPENRCLTFKSVDYPISEDHIIIVKAKDNTHLEFYYTEPPENELSYVVYNKNPEILRDIDDFLPDAKLRDLWRLYTKPYKITFEVPLTNIDFYNNTADCKKDVFQWLVDDIFTPWAVWGLSNSGKLFSSGKSARLHSGVSVQPENIIGIQSV